jgi:hypothetical protein
MSRISPLVLAQAITLSRKMSIQDKEKIGDEIFKAQPNLLGSVLALHRMGVSLVKIDFALNILIVSFLAMKASGHTWPLITLDDQDRQMNRLVGSIKFGTDLGEHLEQVANQQYIDAHPEKYLLAYVFDECASWLKTIEAEESDKYVLLAAANLANCIGIRPIHSNQKKRKC